jgi:hypothetical protein
VAPLILVLYIPTPLYAPPWWPQVGRTNIAAAGTYTLELTTLSRLTGGPLPAPCYLDSHTYLAAQLYNSVRCGSFQVGCGLMTFLFSQQLVVLLVNTPGDPKYARAARRFWKRLSGLEGCDGLYCTW